MTLGGATKVAGLSLPYTTVFSVKKCAEKTIAHALDFDLVAVGSSTEDALQQLRSAVKHHVEFGFKHKLSEAEIHSKAPAEFWSRIKNVPLTLGEPIHIEFDGQSIEIIPTATDESETSLTAA